MVQMKDYDILFIVIAIAISGVAFKITVDDLNVYRIFRVKGLKIVFTSKYNTVIINKLYRLIKYYYQYRLPFIK